MFFLLFPYYFRIISLSSLLFSYFSPIFSLWLSLLVPYYFLIISLLFPYYLLSVPYCFPIISLLLPYVFPYYFPINSELFLYYFRSISLLVRLCVPYSVPIISLWFPYYFCMFSLFVPYVFCVISLLFPYFLHIIIYYYYYYFPYCFTIISLLRPYCFPIFSLVFPCFSSLFPYVLVIVSLLKGVIQCRRRMVCLSVGLRTTYATTILTNAGVGVWDGLTQQLRDLNCPKCDVPAKNCILAPDSHLTQLLLDTCFGPCSPAPLLQKKQATWTFLVPQWFLWLSFCEKRCRWAVSKKALMCIWKSKRGTAWGGRGANLKSYSLTWSTIVDNI